MGPCLGERGSCPSNRDVSSLEFRLRVTWSSEPACHVTDGCDSSGPQKGSNQIFWSLEVTPDSPLLESAGAGLLAARCWLLS